jgi:hypothetical protein
MGQKPDTGTEKQKLVPMEQPLKKHGDKMDLGRSKGEAKKDGHGQTGGAGWSCPCLTGHSAMVFGLG